jgi:hypothetical protein
MNKLSINSKSYYYLQSLYKKEIKTYLIWFYQISQIEKIHDKNKFIFSINFIDPDQEKKKER